MSLSNPRTFFVTDPRWTAAAGATVTAFTAIFVALARTSSSTATFWRCGLALPLLIVLMIRERRNSGSAAQWSLLRSSAVAGLFLGVDMVLWAESISSVGAGVATVVVNVQVIIVPLLAFVISREPIPARYWPVPPVLLCGIALASGAGLGDSGGNGRPLFGAITGLLAGAAYAAYLVVLRRCWQSSGVGWTVTTTSTAAAMLVALAAGVVRGDLSFAPSSRSLVWLALLAMISQVLGWWLVGRGLSRLAAHLGAILLLIQPIAAMLLGVVLLGERPTWAQLAGSAVVLVSVVLVARTRETAPLRVSEPFDSACVLNSVGELRGIVVEEAGKLATDIPEAGDEGLCHEVQNAGVVEAGQGVAQVRPA